MSEKPLRMKDLISVKFTKLDPNASFSALEGHKERYKCPVTGDVLRNSVPCAVLRQTGDVITMEAVKVIKKDMKHPLTSQAMTEKDIIPLQRVSHVCIFELLAIMDDISVSFLIYLDCSFSWFRSAELRTYMF